MNVVTLIGRLTRDPELRFIPNSEKAVCKFSIAVDREFSREKEADFFNIVVWGKVAESCEKYLKKGRLVAINGSLKNNNYEDKNGVKHFNMDVVAQKVKFLEWGDSDQDDSSDSSDSESQQSEDSGEDDALPFEM